MCLRRACKNGPICVNLIYTISMSVFERLDVGVNKFYSDMLC